jgi:hypothetical protein
MVTTSLTALFVVSGHDGPITAALVMGAALVFAGVVLPRLAGEFEIGPSGLKGRLATLRSTVDRAQRSVTPELDGAAASVPLTPDVARADVDEILQEASRSPIAAILLLGRAIEYQLRILFEQTGWIPGNERMTVPRLVAEAERRTVVSISLTSSVRVFWEIRNRVVHAMKPVPEAEILSAIDVGVAILKMIEGIPHEVHTVDRAGLELFRDELGSKPVTGGFTGLRLNSVSPGGLRIDKRIFPTRRTDYQAGDLVGWEWNGDVTLPATWFRDPDDGVIKTAWAGSAEFVGRPLPRA